MAEDSAKKSARQKKNPPNPNGNGGFGDHPENIKLGQRWDSTKSYKYCLRLYETMDTKALETLYNQMLSGEVPHSNAQLRAAHDIIQMNGSFDTLREETLATDHVVKKLHGEGPWIDDEGESVKPRRPIRIEFL